MRRFLAVLVATAVATGCGPGEFDWFGLRNLTDESIFVYWYVDGDEKAIGPILPDRQLNLPVSPSETCSTGLLIARTTSGREVARRTEPLCMDDIWVITAQAP